MTLLELIKEHCRRTGLPVPTAAVASTDDQVLQLWGLFNELADDLNARKIWEKTVREGTWTSNGLEDAGLMTTRSPGYKGLVPDSMFNRTNHIPIKGPVSPEEWQRLKALTTTGPFYRYRMRGGKLLFVPVIPTNHVVAWEYKSNYFVLATDGTTYKQYFTADTDTFPMGDDIAMTWIRWRWKAEKGLEYAEEFRLYESQIGDAMLNDQPKKVVDLTCHERGHRFGIAPPGDGSWDFS